MPHFTLLLGAASLLLATNSVAAPGEHSAQAPGEAPKLRTRNCHHLDSTKLENLLRLELNTLGFPEPPVATEVRVDCFSQALVVSVTAGTQATVDKHIAGDPAATAERELALAASELLVDLWTAELSPSPAPPAPSRAASKPASPRILLDFAAQFYRMEQPSRPALGVSSSLFARVGRNLEFSLALGGGYSESSNADLKVDQFHLAIAPGARFLWPVGRLELGLGARLPLGWVWMAPAALKDGALAVALDGPWSALLAEAGARYFLRKNWFLTGSAECGGVTLPVRGEVNGETVLAVDGLLFGGRVGAGISF